MALRTKTLLMLGSTFVVLLFFLTVISSRILVKSFRQLEEDEVRHEVQRAYVAFSGLGDQLLATTANWAASDEAYAFVAGQQPDWPAETFPQTTLQNLGLAAVIVFNDAGTPVAVSDVGSGNLAEKTIRVFADRPDLKHELLAHADPRSRHDGVMQAGRYTLLVASRPIVQTDKSGPVRGTLLALRIVDKPLVRQLASALQIDLRVLRDTVSEQVNADAIEQAILQPGRIVVQAESRETIIGHRAWLDPVGQPVLVLCVSMPRKLFRQGEAAVVYSTISMLVIGVVCGGVILFIMERLVLARVGRLSRDVLRVALAADRSARVPVDGGDELARLSAAINHMLEALQTSERQSRRLAAAVEQCIEPMFITDTRGIIEYVNPAFERLTGYSRVDVLGLSPDQLVGDAGDTAARRERWLLLQAGQPWSGELTGRRRDGTPFRVVELIAPLRDSAGNTVHFVGVQRDVTHERRLEEQLNQARRLEAIGTVAAGVAHDFNNLLTAIRASIEPLRLAGSTDPQLARALQLIDQATRQGSGLTQALMTFGRTAEPEKGRVDLRHLVGHVGKLVGRLIPPGIRMHLDVPDRPIVVGGDAIQLEQVLVNLALNARDAMPQGGVLTIELSASGGDATRLFDAAAAGTRFARLAVSDTGMGIEAHIAPRIFDPYFSTKPRGQGTGLGLAIVRRIVQEHGGAVSVDSEPGVGSTFNVYMPIMDDHSVAAPPSVNEDDHPTDARIVLADARDSSRDLLASGLESRGYEVLEAVNVGELAAQAGPQAARPPALLVMDAEFEGDALACIARLRSLGINTPVIVLASSAAQIDVDSSGDPPTVFIMRKPVSVIDLARLAGTLLEPASQGALR